MRSNRTRGSMFQKWWQDVILVLAMTVVGAAVAYGILAVGGGPDPWVAVGVWAVGFAALYSFMMVMLRRDQKHHAGSPPPQEPQGIEIEP